MSGFRTTVTLEPDVHSWVQAQLQTPGTSLRAVINEAIRRGQAPRHRVEFHTRTADLGQPRIDLDHALRLAGELDDASALRTLELNS
jgi:hypothetical protein